MSSNPRFLRGLEPPSGPPARRAKPKMFGNSKLSAKGNAIILPGRVGPSSPRFLRGSEPPSGPGTGPGDTGSGPGDHGTGPGDPGTGPGEKTATRGWTFDGIFNFYFPGGLPPPPDTPATRGGCRSPHPPRSRAAQEAAAPRVVGGPVGAATPSPRKLKCKVVTRPREARIR